MKSECFTVVKRQGSAIVERIASFTSEVEATRLGYTFPITSGVDVVRSDLYDTVAEYESDRRKVLVSEARKKLTAEEFEALEAEFMAGVETR